MEEEKKKMLKNNQMEGTAVTDVLLSKKKSRKAIFDKFKHQGSSQNDNEEELAEMVD